MKMILTRGIPGSGKSTFAKDYVTVNPNTVRVSRDDLRRMLFVTPSYEWDQEKLVSLCEKQMVEDALVSGRDVLIDSMNLRARYVRDWQNLAKTYGAEMVYKDFPITLRDAIARDALRSGVEHIGKDFITSTFEKFCNKDGSLKPVPEFSEVENVEVTTYSGTPGKPDTFIFDIDGTLALNLGGRNIYDLTRVHEDSPFSTVVSVLWALARDDFVIVYCSGRSEDSRKETAEWITQNVGVPGPLFMRKSGDFRKDNIVKRELFDDNIRDNYNVVGVFDDRDQVVKMWREMGLQVSQVAYGDF